MNQRLVYSVLRDGSAAQQMGGLIGILLVAGLLVGMAFLFRRMRDKGLSIASSSLRTLSIRTAMADYAPALAIIIGLFCAWLGWRAWHRYQSDRMILENGHYQSWTGPLTQYVSIGVRTVGHRSKLDRLAGTPPTQEEQDMLLAGGQDFYVTCTRSTGTPAAVAGEPGRCLDLHAGQIVRIDFQQLTPSRFSTEPLRIWAEN